MREWMVNNPTFSAAVELAEAAAESRFMAEIERAAIPHEVVEIRTVDDSKKGITTTTVTRKEGDWRAAESWLKRRRRSEWGDNVAIDIDREIERLLAPVADTSEDQTPEGSA
jgi:hypothetical protein